jgi:hypothetical protein
MAINPEVASQGAEIGAKAQIDEDHIYAELCLLELEAVNDSINTSNNASTLTYLLKYANGNVPLILQVARENKFKDEDVDRIARALRLTLVDTEKAQEQRAGQLAIAMAEFLLEHFMQAVRSVPEDINARLVITKIFQELMAGYEATVEKRTQNDESDAQ